MLNLAAPALTSLLYAALPFGAATPTLNPRGCEAPYYQYDQNIPGRYAVNFTEGYTLEKHFATIGQNLNVTTLDTGYYGNLTTDLLEKVRTDCGVQFVEDDTTGVYCVNNIGNLSQTSNFLTRRGTQDDASWPLIQLSASQKDPSDETYYYLDEAGKGVDIYVIDTGINHPQNEFNDDDGNDRIVDLYNLSTDDDFSDSFIKDPMGHGTLMASALGGKKYGVAKGATIFNVKCDFFGEPDSAGLAKTIQRIIRRHKHRKTQDGFKGSIISMSFIVGKSRMLERALGRADRNGISLLGASGNEGYNSDPDTYPALHPKVISVGASTIDYTPRENSNYGENVISLWAPGEFVPLCDKNGDTAIVSGTSPATAYVAGILAIFYGVEGTSINPDLAKTRLMAQTDDWITLPNDQNKDWHNTPTALANTGNRKGAAKDPPVKYIGGPEMAAGTGTTTPGSQATLVCQSPKHDHPLVSFTLDQGTYALSYFNDQCQGIELKPGGPKGCILYFNPCSQTDSANAVDVVISVEQIAWKSGITSTWPDVQEIQDAGIAIMNNCDTTTTSAKWGGYKTVSVASGMRMYNISANQDGQYPTREGFHKVRVTKTSEGEDCGAWDSS